MSADRDRVVVEDGLCDCCSVPIKVVHHRDYPEIHAGCGSVVEAAAHLADQLALYREGAQSDWHREGIDLAIADVRKYLDALSGAEREVGTTCRRGVRSARPQSERCATR